MNQFKRVQVVMLPTGESNLSINRSYKERGIGVEVGKPYLTYCKTFKYYSSVTDNSCNPQHLYIISDDEIKENNTHFYNPHSGQLHISGSHTDYENINKNGCKKIIATTDTSIIYRKGFPRNPIDGFADLPQPSQQFVEKYIEEYNKGNVITDVLVEYELLGHEEIPSELWEKRYKVNPKDNTITIKKLKDSWNREEVIELIYKYCKEMTQCVSEEDEKWIEENL